MSSPSDAWARSATTPAMEAANRIQKMKEEKTLRDAEAADDARRLQEAEKLRCHLHKRPKDSCKFCKKYQDFVNMGKEDKAAMQKKAAGDSASSQRGGGEESAAQGLLELPNLKNFGFPPMLQSHITES